MITVKHHNTLEYLASDLIDVPHGFTTRYGGVSTGALASLNLGTSRGDAPENVLENYRRLGEALGFDPKNAVLCKQIHSGFVRTVTREDLGAGLYRPALTPCDGLVTDIPGAALVVFTADCTPILLYDPVTGAVGAAHAGWRGTVADIAGKTVAAMVSDFGARPENIRAAIGPNIGPCHFETHGDVPQALKNAFGEEMNDYIRPSGEKYYVDLKGVNKWLLHRAGVETVDVSDLCTVCESHRFWSHRVTGGVRGSQGAVIVCKETKP